MGEQTGIEWTHHTFNTHWGCVKVSPGCEHCYAESLDKRTGGKHWGPKSERRFFGEKHWNEPRKWNEKAAQAGERRRVFCSSMADVFEERDDLDEIRHRLMALIEETPSLDWLLLTKRPQAMLDFFMGTSGAGYNAPMMPNVWCGTTVEDQQRADERIPILAAIPAVVRFVSFEPLLGPIALTQGALRDIDWAIVGGESGGGARPMHTEWVKNLRMQLVGRVAFFFKQHGEYGENDDLSRRDKLVRLGKKASGRLLDGREWNELPTPRRPT